MARTYEETMARMAELEKAQSAPAPAPVAVPAPTTARSPAAPKPAAPTGMEALPKPSAALPAPSVTRRAVGVPKKVEEIKAPKVPEVAAPPPPKLVLPPDVARPIDYKKFYDNSTGLLSTALSMTASDFNTTESELKRIAQAQGVDLEAIYNARLKERTYEQIAKAGKERGVIGFMAPEERTAAFNKLADDVEKAQKGDAGDTIDLVRSGADKGFGPAGALGGYTFAGTEAELPEVTKPGEHGYAVAQLLVEALQKDPSAVRTYDLYGRSLATGNTQRYIDDRVDDLRKRANIKASDADAMEKMAALRKRAINEVIAYKTVGQWTPIVTLGDVEVREGRASPGVLDALKPNIEIIGFNNKRQAIFRQESPMGVLFRVIDIPQAAVVGVLSGQTVGQGIQSGANLLEYSLDTTKDSAAYVKAPVVAAGLAASILFPDALVAAGAATKATKFVTRLAKARKIAPEATALLETIVRTRKAGDYEAAAAAEKQLRSLLPDVASNLDSADAAVARFQKLAEPQSDILETDLAALIANAAPEQASVFAGRPFLHPSDRKAVTGPAGIEQADYAELFDTRRHLDRVQKAKTEYVNARKSGRSLSQYAKDYVRGRVIDVFQNLPAERQLSAAQVTRMADLISAQAPTALLDAKQFKAAVEGALKADKEFGTDAYKMARQDAYKAIGGRTETKIAEMRGKTIEEIEAADIGLFDRALKAIEQNNTARGVAAQLLRDEIASTARLRVEPLELFDEVAPKLQSGEPIRLTSGGLLLLHHLRKAFPEQDFKEAYATITIIDKMIEGAAKSREVSPFALYQEIFPAIRRGTPEDLKRLAGDLKAGKVPTGGAPTGGAPTAPAAPTKAARARAEAKLREMMRRMGDEELDEIEGLLRADGVQEGEAYALDAIKREKARRAREAKKAATTDAERITQLEAELEEAVQSDDAFRQGELEMEIENLRQMQPRVVAPPVAATEAPAEAAPVARAAEAPTPTVAAPATPTPISAAAEAQAEAAKIVEAAPAKRPRASRAKKAEAAQTKLFPSIVPLARSAPSPWGDTPKRFVVAAESRLRKAAEDLDAGRVNQVEYDIAVGDVKRDLAAQKAERAVKKSQAQLVRGADDARAKLLQAKAAGVIDEAGADLAEWLIRQNPRIADDLNVAVLTAESAKKRFGVQIGEEVAGFYEPVDRVVALIKERGSELTAAHEILHHTEQMLPEALQTAVVDEWAKQIQKALGTATPEQRPALEKALTGDSAALLKGVTDGTLPRSFYQYSNPSEFWAVNASRIVSGRYATADKGFVAKAKQWLTEFVEKVKSAFGLTSDAPLIRALDDVLKGDGTAVSNMLSETAQFRSMEARANALRYSLPFEKRPVAATLFSGGGLVEAGLQNVVRPGYAVEARGDIAAHYGKVFGEHVENVDVRSVDFKRLADKNIGYLHASPVCKNFSAAKAANAAGEQAFDIETATATARAIDEVKPPVFTLENVAGYEGSAALRLIEDALRRNGYTFDKNVFNAADYGAATTRKRLLLRAVREGDLPPLPEKTGPADWYARIEDLVDDLPKSDVPPFMQRLLDKEGIDWRNLDRPIMVAGGSAWKDELPYAFAGGPTFTIKATPGELHRVILPGGDVREVTPRVLARITGLSDDYPLPKTKDAAVTIIGNGVPLELTDSVFAPLIESRYAQPGRAPVPVAAEAQMPSGIPATRAAQTETPEFKRWFGDSKVVDADGKPLVVYHGTRSAFTKFAPEQSIFDDGSMFFSSSPKTAFEYAKTSEGALEEGGNIMPSYLSMRDPLVVDFRGGRDADGLMDARERAGDLGHDGVIALNVDDGYGIATQYVVFEPTQIKSATGNVGTFSPTDLSILKQVSPSGEVKGAVEWLEDGSSVIYLFEGADASTVLHEVAHVVRRNILSNEDMGFIASWVQGMGVNVGHQYGEFTGDAAEIEKAEELFAKAFEQYVAEGKAPAGLEGAFAQLKDAVANVYKAVKDPVIGVELQPEVRRVFDGLFAAEPTQADLPLKEAIRRGILGGPEAEVDILTVLSREAKRKGLDQFSLDELATRINEAKANIKQILGRDPKGTDVVLKFDTKVLGKDKWTLDDLAAAQAARDARLAPQAEARMALQRDLTGKGRGKAALYKQDTAVESLWTALSDKETDAPMTKQAKKALRGVTSMYFGGSVLEETKTAGQPPAFRRALDTSARIVEQSLADTVALVNDAVQTQDDTQLLRYLTGDFNVAKVSGRPILSSGHDKMGAVNRMIQRAIAAFKADEKAALIELADAINTKDPVARGQKLTTLGFTADGGGVSFKEADEARKAMSAALRRAVGKLLYPEKQDADIGTALAAAIRDSVNAPEKARPSHELRLVETLTYLGGVTARDGDLFKGDSKDVARTLLGDIRKIYGENGEESARRVAVQIGAFGGADQAKQFLARMGLGVDENTQAAFARFLNGEQPGAKNIEGVTRMLNTFGRDVNFVADAALDVDFYIPRAARERMAQVLSRAQFRTEDSVGAADALATGYRYMKTRMTRGNFFIRQRYFMMNTVDHFNAMAYTAGFGIAAASTARVIAQDLLVVPTMRELLEVGKATGVLSPVATERLRSSMQKLGDRAAGRIGTMMSVGKYRIEVNPILEGVDGGFTVGGKVYRYRDIRDIAVEEGVFSSFDTRELQRAILREGQLVLGDAAAEKAVVRSPTRLAWMRNGFASLEESVSDIAEAWGERERLGAMVTLMEAGYDPRTAAQITIKALFDYSQSLTKVDRHWLVGMLLPFWAFQKNANQQVFNMLFSPWGGYRMMAVKRARERTSDLLGNIMYNTLVDDYGVDVESMPPELQDSYYSTIKAFEEAFGPDGPTPEAKRAMRLLLSGRAIDVEGGALVEASAEIQRLRSAGAFADLARFIPFTVAEPSRASRSSIMRDRAGFPVPFPRSEGVRVYNALLGDNHSYMELYWPDSTIEAGMKWHTQVAATMFLLTAEGAAQTGLTGLRKGGIEEVTVQRVLQPIIDVERSPLIAPFLEQPPPKRIAEIATPEAWVNVHPMLGKTMDDLYGTTFLRVPATEDPLLVDEDGNLPQLTPEKIAEIQRLQEQYPDIGVLKKQRYYLPGGVWATAFENSPLGELNSLLLRWEEEPLESQGRKTIQGLILIWARKYAGVDVTLTAPSQAAKREEPRKKTETAGTKTF